MLAERWDGSRWAVQRQPNPATGPQVTSDYGVSCDTAVRCTSVGSWRPTPSLSQTFAERWDGSSWAITSTPNSGYDDLYAVSCASDFCQAVGNLIAGQPIADIWDGASWSAEAVPTFGQPTTAHSVSCWSSSGCMAVGGSGSAAFSMQYAG